MGCENIDDDMLDEVIMNRSTDVGLLRHLGECRHCSVRFANYQRFVNILRRVLADGREMESAGEPRHRHFGQLARF